MINPTKNSFNFTKKSLTELPVPETANTRVIYYDSSMSGLAIRVSSSGSKTFLIYRSVKGKPIKKNLGLFPHMTIDQARNAVSTFLSELAAANFKYTPDSSHLTLREAFDQYVTRHLEKKGSDTEIAAKNFERNFKVWEKKKLPEITSGQIEKLHAEIGKNRGTYAANRMLEQIKAIYGKAIQWKFFTGLNPAVGITEFEELPRTRILTKEEIDKLLTYLNNEGESIRDLRDFLMLAIFTGARKESIYSMAWSEIDFDEQTWSCPREKQKNGQPKIFALTGREQDVLKTRKGLDKVWVFPSDGSKSGRKSKSGHIVDLKKQWQRVREEAKLPDVHIHDLRKTLASWMIRSGADIKVVQSTLNHKDIQTTMFVYAHTQSDQERQAKQDAHDMMLIGKEKQKTTSNVVAFKKSS